MSKDYKLCKRLGPGGLACPCCTPLNSVKKTRQLINRAFRRTKNKNIASQTEEI